MKPTKARLKNYVNELKESVINEIRAKKSKAVDAHVEKEWLKIDPEFKKLYSYFKSLEDHRNLKNEIVDLLSQNDLVLYSFYRDTESRDFDQYKKDFLERINSGSVKGLREVQEIYNREIREVGETYSAIAENLKKITVKQGLIYLEELGFNIDIFKEEEAQLPMIVIDKSKLRLPSTLKEDK